MATGTAIDVVMPQMGVSVSEGTITKWLKQEGEQIEADEALLEISTDKVDTEVPSPASGVVTQILVQEGETVEVGTKLAVIGGEASAAPEAPAPEAPAQPDPAEAPEAVAQPADSPAPEPAPAVAPEPAPAPEPQPAAAAQILDSRVRPLLLEQDEGELRTRRFDPTPYWTGYYATRPLLKVQHLEATQALLAAESFGAIADAAERSDPAAWRTRVGNRTSAIHAAWTMLVPSNHHDFITGTALDPVYEDEQLPRLSAALAAAETERTSASAEIVAAIRPLSPDEADTTVVFNSLGFARRGLVEVSEQPAAPDAAAQASAEGGRLLLARVPSLGYATEDRARVRHDPGEASLDANDGATVVLENALLRATLRQDAAWGITSLVDKRSGDELIRAGEVGNAFVPYADEGGLYRFGDEMEGCSLQPQTAAVTGRAGTVWERGPLRARFVGTVTIDGRTFQKEYQLVAGEPFLRMIATGSAAQGTSVMVHFPLAGRIDRLLHGTPYHWDRKRPERAGALTFEATHQFLITELHGEARAAIFHAGVPAWAVQRDGTVIGALWRNANREQCDFLGAEGTDAHDVALSYALRVPTGIREPKSGAQLREALGFSTPLTALVGHPTGDLPRTFSLARATPKEAIVTAAKAGTTDPDALVLRVYQPTNRRLRVVLHTAARRRFPPGARLGLDGVTALESPLPSERASALELTGQADDMSFVAAHALTTVAIRAAE